MDEAAFDKQCDINVKGAYFVIKHAAPTMLDGASIILTVGCRLHVGGNQTGYGAIKAALRLSALLLANWRRAMSRMSIA